jgi:hypothetical protein
MDTATRIPTEHRRTVVVRETDLQPYRRNMDLQRHDRMQGLATCWARNPSPGSKVPTWPSDMSFYHPHLIRRFIRRRRELGLGGTRRSQHPVDARAKAGHVPHRSDMLAQRLSFKRPLFRRQW